MTELLAVGSPGGQRLLRNSDGESYRGDGDDTRIHDQRRLGD
jgi:hypothetical protein